MASMPAVPADFAGSDETFDTIQIETPDYTDYELLAPGFYTSAQRTVKVEQRTDKKGKPFVMARLEFGALTSEEAGTIFLRKPVVKYIFTFSRKERNRQGETSDVAKYLRAVGITLGGDVNVEQLKQALSESAAYPVKVRIEWTNRTPKNEATGDYLPEKAYTSDFNRGSNGTSHFVARLSADDISALSEKRQAALAEVLVNGSIQAKHKVGEFYKV